MYFGGEEQRRYMIYMVWRSLKVIEWSGWIGCTWFGNMGRFLACVCFFLRSSKYSSHIEGMSLLVKWIVK